jgi:orotate phosphoribosyltransferase-like protein
MLYDSDCFLSVSLKEVAKSMIRQINRLNKSGACIDTIISRGSSGCTLASAILALSKKDLYHLHIRKPNETSHGVNEYAGEWGHEQAVIVDDFIMSGKTITTILGTEVVKKRKAKVIGVLIGAKKGSHEAIKVYCCGK